MTLLPEIFADAVRRWPQHVAVDIPPGRDRPARAVVTYADLNAAAHAIAHRLRPVIRGECVVGIFLRRTTPQLFSAQLAVLSAGAAYTCLDPAFPDERVREILADAEVSILLTDGEGRARLQRCGGYAGTVLDVGAILATQSLGNSSAAEAAQCAPAPPAWLTPATLAYVIYTSGTSGKPKGVMIEHRSIANLVDSDREAFQLTPGARVAQGSSAAYDSSIEETWLAFAAGATLVVMDDDAARLGPDLIGWLQRERISVFCPPPTLLRATGCTDPAAALPDLKLLYVGGEALPRDVADRWSVGRILVNGYGPTECTVTCLRERVAAGDPITIGRPVPGATAWVLDEAGGEVATCGQGELCMGGIGVARGYWKQPTLTAEKFITHPQHGRLYRTGDLVHRDEAGRFFYHGRIDSQVKLRGYRIELGEIEARLAGLPGVRAAGCRMQTDAGQDSIVAFVVPADSATPPALAELKSALGMVLPGHMVPSRIGLLDELPTTVGGKLNRAALPRLEGALRSDAITVVPRDPMEERLAAALRMALQFTGPVSIHDDFFNDLGGDSLRAAQLVTLLRQDPATARITVRDIYEARSVAALAARAVRVTALHEPQSAASPQQANAASARPLLVTVLQAVWLTAAFTTSAIASGWLAFRGLSLLTREEGLTGSILLAPLLVVVATAIYTPLALLAAVAAKRLLIGRYQPLRAPVWGSFYLRHWIVQQMVRLVPWSMFGGTVLQIVALRALGARIGQRVHIHRDVDLLQGGWDLLEIGDDVTLSQSSSLGLVDLDAGQIVISPVALGAGSTLDIRAGVAGHTVLEPGAFLTALSSLPTAARIPRNECWDGIPARPVGHAPRPPPLAAAARKLTPWQHGALLSLARAGVAMLLVLPIEAVAIILCQTFDLTAEQLWNWVLHANGGWEPWLVLLGAELLLLPLILAWMAVVTRMLGPVAPGTISRWSPAYLRIWLKPGLVDAAGEWISGTLFWPIWLRWAGMKIGRGCEISAILDVVPELIELGSGTFLADGIYLGGPRVQQGCVTLAPTRLGKNTFLGNHVVVAAGQQLPENVLLGVATAANDQVVRQGSSWFGHPPFELPRRQVVTMERRLTHEPSAVLYLNRLFWEALRFVLPVLLLLVLVAWFRILGKADAVYSAGVFLAGVVPLVTFGAFAFPSLFLVALKWCLLGRMRPGQHAFWSSWCNRWAFLYTAWALYPGRMLQSLEGTLLLSWYLRAMGVKIGRRVVLGPGFTQVVDPDMIEIGDGATVNAIFQAHTFEDRVLKIDRIIIQRNATLASATVPLYGAHVGEGAHVASHSVIMKGEHLMPGLYYEGAPTRERQQ